MQIIARPCHLYICPLTTVYSVRGCQVPSWSRLWDPIQATTCNPTESPQWKNLPLSPMSSFLSMSFPEPSRTHSPKQHLSTAHPARRGLGSLQGIIGCFLQGIHIKVAITIILGFHLWGQSTAGSRHRDGTFVMQSRHLWLGSKESPQCEIKDREKDAAFPSYQELRGKARTREAWMLVCCHRSGLTS